MELQLQGQHVLVTGASRGIGRQIALDFARAGAKVSLISRGREALEEVAREIEGLSLERANVFPCDVSDEEQVAELFQQLKEAGLTKIDVLVNNAGITRDGLVMRMKQKDWADVMRVNLESAFLLSRGVARGMLKARSGCIINVTSVIGVMGNAGQANYAASKAGLIGLTKSLAREFASRGVRVNAIAPGYIDTDMTNALNDKVQQEILANIPLGEIGTPSDVAQVALFLASPMSRYITGQVLNVDGGMVM